MQRSRGQIASTSLVQTQYSYYPWSTTTYGGRLESIKSGRPYATPTPLPTDYQDLRYTYDAMSNITAIQDWKNFAPPQLYQQQTFSYDALDRLTQSVVANGGVGNYSESYSYAANNGNLLSKNGVNYTYGSGSHVQAVTSLSNGASYQYDQNGNMTQRFVNGGQPYNLAYDAENHMTTVSGAASASFVYNGDGQRVIATENGTTTIFIGNYLEWSGSASTMKKYYFAGATRLAVRTGIAAPQWLLSDHLGSTSKAVNYDGSTHSEMGYKAYGESRFVMGSLPTKYLFTGQYRDSYINLDYFNARWYDPYLNRWTQPDSIIPEAQEGVLAWDRYEFANSNPLKHIDPSGHWIETALDIAFIAYDLIQINQEGWTLVNTVALAADVACAIVPIATGGGPALRTIVASGDAVMAMSQTAIHVPEAVRVVQGTEKIIQFAEGTDTNDVSTPKNYSEPPTLNSRGDSYPTIIDPRTGNPISAPRSNLAKIHPEQRVSWGNEERAAFIKEWYDRRLGVV